MGRVTFFFAGAALVLFAACGGPYRVQNPEFDRCAADCVAAHNRCMVNATSAEDIQACNNKQAACVNSCEGRHPRYIMKEDK